MKIDTYRPLYNHRYRHYEKFSLKTITLDKVVNKYANYLGK